MTEHLFAIELGPVVQIIAAARKTRDMFFGSWMLSEIAKGTATGAARKAAELAGDAFTGAPHELLIVPAPKSLDGMLEDQHFAVGDEILLKLPANVNPRKVADAAREAAHACWVKFAIDARKRVEKEEKRIGKSLIRKEVWDEQTQTTLVNGTAGDVIEVYACWTPLTEDYKSCLAALKRLMLGRNACRNFPPADGHESIPKSSLDGRRESVLVKPEDFNEDGSNSVPVQNRKLRLNRGEQLDALGVTKRVGEGRKNYPSTARLAADPWIRGALQTASKQFQTLRSECEKLSKHDRSGEDPVLGRVNVCGNEFPVYEQFKEFAYEGAILYENRHHEFIDESDIKEQRLRDMQKALTAVTKKHGQPQSYYAALVADGDRIGQLLRNCSDASKHRTLSETLTRFAGEVRGIVDNHKGALIFAAGEDITALLPVDSAIDCANSLRLRFAEMMKPTNESNTQPTLSVGVAIGHFLDALEATLSAARDMEGFAKKFPETGDFPSKNALAVTYISRGGAPIRFRKSWETNPQKSIEDWIDQFRVGNIPEKVPYDLRKVAVFYEHWPIDNEEQIATRQRALQADLLRTLSKKTGKAWEQIEPLIRSVKTPEEAIELANLIIISGVIRKGKDQGEAR